MDVMLTSFGVRGSRPPLVGGASLYYHMPPVRIYPSSDEFSPDYALLLLCEKLIMDEASFSMLSKKPNPLYKEVSRTVKALHTEGFIKLVDFNSILDSNKNLLEKMLEQDLETVDFWIDSLKESVAIWDNFTQTHERLISVLYGINRLKSKLNRRYYLPDGHGEIPYNDTQLMREALQSSKKRRLKEYHSALKRALRWYLSYVNANIILSNELGVGFHDWGDFSPFYNRKFLAVGIEGSEISHQKQQVQKLFEVAFPEFAVTNTSTLLRVLKDKRISDLRKLVQDARSGTVTFDREFANRVLQEVLAIERQITRYRSITSYLTIPIDFLPWIGTVAQKVAEESLGILIEKKLRMKHSWFYMLSNM